MPKVKNIKNTTWRSCNCGSWKAHWSIFSNRDVEKCSVYGCENTVDIIGAHVKITEGDRNFYIIPLCKKHNNSKHEMNISMFFSLSFVSANVQKTCC